MKNTDEGKADRRTNLALRTILVPLAVVSALAAWYWA